jgi:hypothetical protein
MFVVSAVYADILHSSYDLIVIAASGKDFALTELGVRYYVIASVIVKEGTLRMDLYRIMWARGSS